MWCGWFDLWQRIMAGEVLDKPLLQVLVSWNIQFLLLFIDFFIVGTIKRPSSLLGSQMEVR